MLLLLLRTLAVAVAVAVPLRTLPCMLPCRPQPSTGSAMKVLSLSAELCCSQMMTF